MIHSLEQSERFSGKRSPLDSPSSPPFPHPLSLRALWEILRGFIAILPKE